LFWNNVTAEDPWARAEEARKPATMAIVVKLNMMMEDDG